MTVFFNFQGPRDPDGPGPNPNSFLCDSLNIFPGTLILQTLIPLILTDPPDLNHRRWRDVGVDVVKPEARSGSQLLGGWIIKRAQRKKAITEDTSSTARFLRNQRVYRDVKYLLILEKPGIQRGYVNATV